MLRLWNPIAAPKRSLPATGVSIYKSRRRVTHTVLDQDVQALFNGQRGIENDETETQREDIIAVADFEEVANGTLVRETLAQCKYDLQEEAKSK